MSRLEDIKPKEENKLTEGSIPITGFALGIDEGDFWKEGDVFVGYNTFEETKEVYVTISADTEIKPLDGWTLSEDKKTLSKIYIDNVEKEKIKVIYVDGTEKIATIEISNIDRVAPETVVGYDVTRPTIGNVVATISSDKAMQEMKGWNLSEDKLTLSKEYKKNVDEKIIVRDLAGNEREVEVKIENINKGGILGRIQNIDRNLLKRIGATVLVVGAITTAVITLQRCSTPPPVLEPEGPVIVSPTLDPEPEPDPESELESEPGTVPEEEDLEEKGEIGQGTTEGTVAVEKGEEKEKQPVGPTDPPESTVPDKPEPPVKPDPPTEPDKPDPPVKPDPPTEPDKPDPPQPPPEEPDKPDPPPTEPDKPDPPQPPPEEPDKPDPPPTEPDKPDPPQPPPEEPDRPDPPPPEPDKPDPPQPPPEEPDRPTPPPEEPARGPEPSPPPSQEPDKPSPPPQEPEPQGSEPSPPPSQEPDRADTPPPSEPASSSAPVTPSEEPDRADTPPPSEPSSASAELDESGSLDSAESFAPFTAYEDLGKPTLEMFSSEKTLDDAIGRGVKAGIDFGSLFEEIYESTNDFDNNEVGYEKENVYTLW